MTAKKIVIAGGTGFIGRAVAEYFTKGNEVVILSRGTRKSSDNSYRPFKINQLAENVRVVNWDGKSQGEWGREIDGCDLVINLAGKSVNCRYTSQNKQAIIDSRVLPTAAIGEAIRNAIRPPFLWINAASATIYRHAEDTPQDEYTGEIKNDFSVRVCKQWEAALFNVRAPFTRKIALRTAVTLGLGGVMVPYMNLVNWGLGGRQGAGTQMFSWVHIDDVCRAIEFLYTDVNAEGVYNLSAPNPVKNAEFMKVLREEAGRRIGLPAYKWMLSVGAAVIGTETELLLKSRWVVPAKLLKEGFRFKYPELQPAVHDIVATKKHHQQPVKTRQQAGVDGAVIAAS